MLNTLYHTCIDNRLPEDESSGSKHVEDNKNVNVKIIYKRFILLV